MVLFQVITIMLTNEDQVLVRLSDPFPCHLRLRAFRGSGSQLCRLRTQYGGKCSCIAVSLFPCPDGSLYRLWGDLKVA